ncbi:ribonuclease HI family protein [Candidatus Gottesmanbacteria bacterium]|nr:ribonuclease HI family protein [Candidatus Gottesmanbacteria bacterium]
MQFIVHTDGGARGNPGPAAVGAVIQRTEDRGQRTETKTIAEISKRIGETTNNVAEYTAVVEALEYIKSQGDQTKTEIQFFLDSMLVVNQLNGLFKVKDVKLRELLAHIWILEQEVGGVVHYTSIPREHNRRADFLVNKALDNNS